MTSPILNQNHVPISIRCEAMIFLLIESLLIGFLVTCNQKYVQKSFMNSWVSTAQDLIQGHPLFPSSFSAAESPLTHPQAPNTWRSLGDMESLCFYHKTWWKPNLSKFSGHHPSCHPQWFQLKEKKKPTTQITVDLGCEGKLW